MSDRGAAFAGPEYWTWRGIWRRADAPLGEDAVPTLIPVRSSWTVLEGGRVARAGERPGVAGRYRRGHRMGRQVLTEQQVRAIRARLADGETQRSLAAAYGVSQTTIGSIGLGNTWRHV